MIQGEVEGAFLYTVPQGPHDGEGAFVYTAPQGLRECEGETQFMRNLRFENFN